jgi:site-specific DNA recombinase
MRNYYAYIRVSTVRQGEKGSSLQEQRAAIESYADKHGLTISAWFEEKETAAKRGRAVFRRILTDLKRGRAHGLIMHKVDRGARNLADWAELAGIMDAGVDVHFAYEALDLSSRGGRLSADIQAVVAADFIRNLRDEVKKGLYGRIRQGIYPFAAPVGYQNNGKAALKTIDPVQGPLVRQAFELYASGRFGLHGLRAEMTKRGLHNQHNRPFYTGSLGKMLKSPFYYGAMQIKGHLYEGKHQPIISKALFDACQERAAGRLVSATRVWGAKEYRYRGLVTCGGCGSRMTAEMQGRYAYYRCRSGECRGACINEEYITSEIGLALSCLPLSPKLESFLIEAFRQAEVERHRSAETLSAELHLQLAQIEAREARLTDSMIDGVIDRTAYETRRNVLLGERATVTERLQNFQFERQKEKATEKFTEVIKALENMAFFENEAEIREIVKSASPKIAISGKSVAIQWSKAISVLINVGGYSYCADERIVHLERRQSVTDDVLYTPSGTTTLTEGDKRFRNALIAQASELYKEVISQPSFDRRYPPKLYRKKGAKIRNVMSPAFEKWTRPGVKRLKRSQADQLD